MERWVLLRDDEYELMPHTELEYLRKEVERLKRNPLGDTQASISLLDSMNKLNTSIARLNDILQGANDDMVKAYSDTSVQEQLRRMAEQNEKLARGIVAVAELVKEQQKKQPVPDIDQFIQARQPAPQPVQQQAAVDQTSAMRSRNPFSDESSEFAPPLNQPLPRPNTVSPELVEQVERLRPTEPTQQQANAPGFMMRPGVRERIPDADIPPPPPRRF